MAWSSLFTMVATLLFFAFTISPARAPQGGKNSLGGRTIASMQEEDFDRRLMNYQICYGVRFFPASATFERRRVCKAMLVHRLDLAFQKSGAFLKNPVEFHCDDTAFGKKEWENNGVPAAALKPNAEYQAMDKLLEANMEYRSVTDSEEQYVKETCQFLTSCKNSMRRFYLRQVGECLSTPNVLRRKVLIDEIGTMVFSPQAEPKVLYSELVDEARK